MIGSSLIQQLGDDIQSAIDAAPPLIDRFLITLRDEEGDVAYSEVHKFFVVDTPLGIFASFARRKEFQLCFGPKYDKWKGGIFDQRSAYIGATEVTSLLMESNRHAFQLASMPVAHTKLDQAIAELKLV